MRPENAGGPPGLNQQSLVVLERLKRSDNRMEGRPISRRPAGASINHEIFRPLGNLGIQVVVQHAQGCFLVPALAREFPASRGADWSSHGQLPYLPPVDGEAVSGRW